MIFADAGGAASSAAAFSSAAPAPRLRSGLLQGEELQRLANQFTALLLGHPFIIEAGGTRCENAYTRGVRLGWGVVMAHVFNEEELPSLRENLDFGMLDYLDKHGRSRYK